MTIEVFTGGAFQTNGYLVQVGDTRILVDAPEGASDWLAGKDTPPDALLFTHLHYDHVVDAAAVQSRFGCPLWSHSNPDPDLTLETLLQQMPGPDFTIEPFTIDRLLAGEEKIEIGSLAFDLHWVPGHSPDSLCFRAEIGDDDESLASVVFGGDVLFRDSIGRTDFPHGDHQQLLTGIRDQLYPLPGETVVYPGHGPSTTIEHERNSNPYVRA